MKPQEILEGTELSPKSQAVDRLCDAYLDGNITLDELVAAFRDISGDQGKPMDVIDGVLAARLLDEPTILL